MRHCDRHPHVVSILFCISVVIIGLYAVLIKIQIKTVPIYVRSCVLISCYLLFQHNIVLVPYFSYKIIFLFNTIPLEYVPVNNCLIPSSPMLYPSPSILKTYFNLLLSIFWILFRVRIIKKNSNTVVFSIAIRLFSFSCLFVHDLCLFVQA